MTPNEKINDMLDILAAQKSLFTEFERKFLLSVHAQTSRGKTLSEKQIETIDSIYTKICES